MKDPEYNFKRQRIIKRNDSGKILSLMPIYNKEAEVLIQIDQLIRQYRNLAITFPSVKLIGEVNSIPERDFKIIKEDLEYSNADITDHGNRIYYQITVNCVLVMHQEI
jgi:hypothetical protein